MPSSSNVTLGPGLLYVAAIGVTEPTDATSALPSAWRAVGYTEEGSTFTYEINNEAIEVAEEFDPVAYKTTSRSASVQFQMAEATRRNLALALNSGASVTDSGAVEPPSPGSEVRVQLVLDTAADPASPNSTHTGARWIFRRCLQADSVEIAHHKAPDKTLIPVNFRLEKPSGQQPFKVIPDASGLI